jgi:hypothetical protein
MVKYFDVGTLDMFDMSYLYSLYLTNNKNVLLNNYYYPSYNIEYKEIKIEKKKLNLKYKIKQIDNKTIITLYNGKIELKSFLISNNLMKTYKIRYKNDKIKEDYLIKVLAVNLFTLHKDIYYLFNPVLYEIIKDLDFKFNLIDTINSLFLNYGSINYFESFFQSLGSIFDMKLYMGNYFITIPNDQIIFDNIIKFIEYNYLHSHKILFIGIYYPSIVNKQKVIDDKNIKSLKKYIIKKYVITTNYYYDYYDKSKYYPNSKFELLFFINLINSNVNKDILAKYNNYITKINKLKTILNKLKK